ncbi:hypothetical protein HJG60_012185 [Phyllostomus discolor]|uniref:Uncharacterized protein n=1 Tax=Phyllostomus discolor TaxID=89673 RepID=A0A833ZE29_9CHIR|nr:hypothetical protein HJG60_012185 [Phyllostomus discolor]
MIMLQVSSFPKGWYFILSYFYFFLFLKCDLTVKSIYLYLNFFLLLFKYNCLHFHPTMPPTPPISASHPLTHPLWLSPCVLHMCSLMVPPIIPYYPSPSSSLITVRLFFISMSVVVFCLLVCFVGWFPLIGEIVWYFSFTAWLVSLSIMLSGSIQAVAKDRVSFFLLHSIPSCKCTIVF